MASSPVIGVARSWGAFFVNNASVPGSATVLDGASVKTADASSNLNLTGGERVTLAANSAAFVHPDRLTLEHGAAEFGGAPAYRLEARNVRVETADSGARIRVAIDSKNRVLVASIGGAAEVRSSQGRLVARVASGAAMSFAAASPEAADVTGKVVVEDGKYYLTDLVTKEKVELRAHGLAKLVGKLVHIVGTFGSPDGLPAGVSQVVMVETAKIVVAAVAGAAGGAAGGAAAGGTVAVAGAGGAAAGAGATAAGLSTLAVTGIAVGGAGAATVGGLAAAGTIGSSSDVSR
jgi:hypothetical protein